jgi:membrane-bound lytic murein transglycosylase B
MTITAAVKYTVTMPKNGFRKTIRNHDIASSPLPHFYLPMVVFMITFVGVFLSTAIAKLPDDPSFKSVQGYLVHDGFDPDRIAEIYRHPKVNYDIKGVSLFFVHRESTLNYDQFMSASSLRKARKYMKVNSETLTLAESIFGVDPEVITAILLVETRLGTMTGNRSVLNTLSTMAALKDSSIREYFWVNIPEERRLTKEKFEKKADRKSKWAYKELKAFIEYTQREQIIAAEIKGSYAGAFGIAQFIPTSIQAYARDGNADNKIDLFTHEDAIFSIANYLKKFGWKPGISRKKQEKVIFQYNRSKYYVNIILRIKNAL